MTPGREGAGPHGEDPITAVTGGDDDWSWGVALHASREMGMGTSVPMSGPRAAAIFAWCGARGYSRAKLLHIRRAISVFHLFGGNPDPCYTPVAARTFARVAARAAERDLVGRVRVGPRRGARG